MTNKTKKTIEDRVQIATRISNLIGEQNYAPAEIALESLPVDFPKGPIYAALAIKLAERLEGSKKTEGISFDLISRMIEYCKGKSGDYFKQ